MRGILSKWWGWPVWARVLSGLVALFLGSAVIAGIKGTASTQTALSTASSAHSASPSQSAALTAVTLPSVVGETKADAAKAVASVGVQLGSVETRPTLTQPAGIVLSQTPRAGTQVLPGTVIRLVVAGAPPRVPSVIGASASDAEATLKDAGFSVTLTTRTVDNGRDGVVLSETPSGGTPEMPGSTVRLTSSHLYVAPPPPPPAPAQPSCTTTNSGSCIQGGEFCRKADYGTTGYDADGRAWTCTGNQTHPHWE